MNIEDQHHAPSVSLSECGGNSVKTRKGGKTPKEKYLSLPDDSRAKIRELVREDGATKLPPYRIKGGYVVSDDPKEEFSSVGPVVALRAIVDAEATDRWRRCIRLVFLLVGTLLLVLRWGFRPCTDVPETVSEPASPRQEYSKESSAGSGNVRSDDHPKLQLAEPPIFGSLPTAVAREAVSATGRASQPQVRATTKNEVAGDYPDGANGVLRKALTEQLSPQASDPAKGVSSSSSSDRAPETISDLWKSISDLFPNNIQKLQVSGDVRSEMLSEDLSQWASYREALPQFLPQHWRRNWRSCYWPDALIAPWANTSAPVVAAEEFGRVTSVTHTVGLHATEGLFLATTEVERLWCAVQILEAGTWQPNISELRTQNWTVSRRPNGVVFSTRK